MPFAFDRYWRLLAAYLAPRRAQVALLALLIFGGTALQLLSPQIIRRFIDVAQAGGPSAALMGAAGLYILVALSQRAAALASIYMGENLGWRATNRLRSDLARHVIDLDMGFHKVHSPGELIERLDGDVTALANFFSQFSVRVLGNAALIIGVLALLWREDWRIGLGLSAYALAALFALGALQGLASRRWDAARQAQAEQYGFLDERMAGTEDIRASGAEGYVLGRFAALLREAMLRYRSARLVGNVAYAITSFSTTAGYAAGLAIGVALYQQGAVSIGTAFLIVAYVGMLAGPLEHLRAQAQDLQQAGASVDRVAALFAEQPLVAERPVAHLPVGPLGVEVNGVSFSYDDGDRRGAAAPAADTSLLEDLPCAAAPLLYDITISLAPGQILGLLGRTGSGKTTLSRLLLRLYDPQAGALRLGGVDLRDLALADLRGRVGVVTQDVQLFHATLRENLSFFDPALSDARMLDALGDLGLGEWLAGLPEGLDTQIGGGQGLSAGEAQLLAFARVFLKDPGFIILDEASSRLDPATERLLERALARLLAGRTAIIIAHRLSTVQRADQIAILDGGRLAEYGPRADLAANADSRFARLLRGGMQEVLA
jgi:ABC-type multidrug transport system fused ATPase/permease subunit